MGEKKVPIERVIIPYGTKLEIKTVNHKGANGDSDCLWSIRTEHIYKEGFDSPNEAAQYAIERIVV